MEDILPSAGAYKVNARINDLSLDELSFLSSGAEIQPFFEDVVSGDPDVTGLMVYLKDAKGDIVGWKVIYILNGHTYTGTDNPPQNTQEVVSNEDDENSGEDETDDTAEDSAENSQITAQVRNGEELFIAVKNLDNLPLFPLPPNLRRGTYTLVSQVLSEDVILDKTEKLFFYLADAAFSFDSILINQPGVTETPQLIYINTVIMLEAILEFDSGLDPYIVWYNGRRKIAEGSYSSGAGNLLWEAPEQSGFFSLRAEAFPVSDHGELAGFAKDVSLLVSTKTSDMHLLSEDSPNLLHWYIFEGNLSDSKMKSSTERALKPAGNISPKWMPAGGTYGLVTGLNNVYTLPEVSLSNNRAESWRILFRFKPLNNGEIFNVQFVSSTSTVMTLSIDNDNLTLTLASSKKSISAAITLPEKNLFITAAINFSALSDRLSAALNITGDFGDVTELSANPIALETETAAKYIITLGGRKNSGVSEDRSNTAALNQTYSALWDELAVIIDLPSETNTAAGEKIDSNLVEKELPDEEEQPEAGGNSGSVSTF